MVCPSVAGKAPFTRRVALLWVTAMVVAGGLPLRPDDAPSAVRTRGVAVTEVPELIEWKNTTDTDLTLTMEDKPDYTNKAWTGILRISKLPVPADGTPAFILVPKSSWERRSTGAGKFNAEDSRRLEWSIPWPKKSSIYVKYTRFTNKFYQNLSISTKAQNSITAILTGIEKDNAKQPVTIEVKGDTTRWTVIPGALAVKNTDGDNAILQVTKAQ